MSERGRRGKRRAGLTLALVLGLAVTPGLVAAQSRPCPQGSGSSSGSDVDTARAVIGLAGLLSRKAREAEAKKKEEAARKKREAEEAAARQAESEAAAAAAASAAPTAPPAPVTVTAPAARQPVLDKPAAKPAAVAPPPTARAKPIAATVPPVSPQAPPPAPVPAPPPPPPASVEVGIGTSPLPESPGPAPAPTAPPPPPKAAPWSAIGLGVGTFLVILAAAVLTAARALGWLAPPPSAKAWVDLGDPPAPVFSPALSGPLPSLEVSRGDVVSEAHYPEPAG